MKKDYSELLKDPRWQKKRLEILQRDKFTCQSCGNKESTLNVHHRTYISGKMLWEYDNDDLITYCDNCHSQIHELIYAIKNIMGFMSINQLTYASDIMWKISKSDNKTCYDTLEYITKKQKDFFGKMSIK